MTSVAPTFEVPFGVLNIKGLMTTNSDRVVEHPVFAHSTYPITLTLDPTYNKSFGNLSYYDKKTNPTFEGKTYQKLYRKIARWNFGDGTEIEGYSATHAYSLPGKYTITCTFFDINRQGVQNGYSVQVIVKQVIPTTLSFVKEESSKESITCSKIEKLARVEALLSNNVKDDMDVIAKRIYDEGESEETTWDDVKNLEFPHLRKYQTFLEKHEEYYYNTRVVYKEIFEPIEKYSPEYENLYGYFSVNANNIVFNCYRVQPYKNVELMPNIKVNNPNASILSKETFSSFAVIDVSTESELPKEAVLAGKRAFVDVFYRTDFVKNKDVVYISFDIDNINVHNSIESSTNFLNIAPLGIHFSVTANNVSDANFSCTLNGFVTSFEPVDKLVELSLAKDYKFNTLLIPYFRSEYNDYYIPKDFDFKKFSIVTTKNTGDDTTIIPLDDQLPYVKAYEITGKTKANFNIKVTQVSLLETIAFNYDVKDLDSIILPTEKYYNQDVKKLVDVYTPHEMFQNTPKLKETLVRVFENKRFLDYVLTKGINFFDDNVNIKSNYVVSLLDTLKMMGKDAFEYDQTTFEGVNELRDLCRILSMNHTELVGNLIDEEYDIKYTEHYKGKHIGDEIFVNDEIFVLDNENINDKNVHNKGKVIKIIRYGKEFVMEEPPALVVRDNYTNETKIVSFSDIVPDHFIWKLEVPWSGNSTTWTDDSFGDIPWPDKYAKNVDYTVSFSFPKTSGDTEIDVNITKPVTNLTIQDGSNYTFNGDIEIENEFRVNTSADVKMDGDLTVHGDTYLEGTLQVTPHDYTFYGPLISDGLSVLKGFGSAGQEGSCGFTLWEGGEVNHFDISWGVSVNLGADFIIHEWTFSQELNTPNRFITFNNLNGKENYVVLDFYKDADISWHYRRPEGFDKSHLTFNNIGIEKRGNKTLNLLQTIGAISTTEEEVSWDIQNLKITGGVVKTDDPDFLVRNKLRGNAGELILLKAEETTDEEEEEPKRSAGIILTNGSDYQGKVTLNEGTSITLGKNATFSLKELAVDAKANFKVGTGSKIDITTVNIKSGAQLTFDTSDVSWSSSKTYALFTGKNKNVWSGLLTTNKIKFADASVTVDTNGTLHTTAEISNIRTLSANPMLMRAVSSTVIEKKPWEGDFDYRTYRAPYISKEQKELNLFFLSLYKPAWGWGLLLPENLDKDGKVIESYYSFYLLKKPDHIIRVGNYLEEYTITPEVENKDVWEKTDGKTYDKLQKVIHEALDVNYRHP